MKTKSTRKLTVCLLTLLVCAACSKTPESASSPAAPAGPATSPAAQRITSESVVKATAERIEIPAGKSAEAAVRLTIQSGYHVNANPPTFPYLKATKLEIPTADGVSSASVAYPKAVTRKFPFAEESLAVYEGEAVLKATLKADSAAKKGERSLPARLSIQACDDKMCYPPGMIEVAIPVNVN
jgi:DsbC/DsbD-like thiol-disulfide interchange protein